MARLYTFTLFITILVYRTDGGWEPIDDLCTKRLNLDRKVMEPIVNKALHTFENRDYLAYTECYWKEYKLINENDEIDWEQIENIVPKKLKRIKNISTIIQTCKASNIQGKSNGEIAVKIQNCIFLTPLLNVLKGIEAQKRNSSANTT